MNTSPSQTDDQVDSLIQALRAVHKALIEVESRTIAPDESPLALLELTATDPRFAWLRPLSRLITDVVDLRHTNREPITPSVLRDLRASVEELLPGTEVDDRFCQRYRVLIQESPDVAIAHGALRRALNQLPEPALRRR